MSDGPSVDSLSLFPAFFRLPCSAMAHSARLDNNNNTSNPSPASALYYYSTFNKWRRCAWWVFFSTQFADRLRNASTSIVGKNTAKVW